MRTNKETKRCERGRPMAEPRNSREKSNVWRVHERRTYRDHWCSPLLPLCSHGSWGRNTRGCCVHPAVSSSILASHIPSVRVRGSTLQMSSLATLNNPPKWRKYKKATYLCGSGIWITVYSFSIVNVGTLRYKN